MHQWIVFVINVSIKVIIIYQLFQSLSIKPLLFYFINEILDFFEDFTTSSQKMLNFLPRVKVGDKDV